MCSSPTPADTAASCSGKTGESPVTEAASATRPSPPEWTGRHLSRILPMSFAKLVLDACGRSGRGMPTGPGASTRIDDRRESDGYPGFCEIHVSAPAPDGSSVLLELSPAPHNAEVCELVERHGGQIRQGSLGATIQLSLTFRDARHVRDLARAIRRVTRRGQRYPDPNWKWICPRTADSLERFARLLAQARHQPTDQPASAEPGPARSGRSGHDLKRG
jgi:hypothetical protein